VASAATLLRIMRISIVANFGLLSIGRPGIYFELALMDYAFDYYRRLA